MCIVYRFYPCLTICFIRSWNYFNSQCNLFFSYYCELLKFFFSKLKAILCLLFSKGPSYLCVIVFSILFQLYRVEHFINGETLKKAPICCVTDKLNLLTLYRTHLVTDGNGTDLIKIFRNEWELHHGEKSNQMKIDTEIWISLTVSFHWPSHATLWHMHTT